MSRPLTATLAVLTLLAATGCGDQPAEPVAETPAPASTSVSNELPVELPRSPSAEGARVFIITPQDGATVTSPFRIEFGLEGMDLAPAGDQQPNSGHHHLLVNAGLPNLSVPIPANDNYIHYGDARTATDLTLEPGQHTLQLLFGDYLHIPHNPPVMSEVITITVE